MSGLILTNESFCYLVQRWLQTRPLTKIIPVCVKISKDKHCKCVIRSKKETFSWKKGFIDMFSQVLVVNVEIKKKAWVWTHDWVSSITLFRMLFCPYRTCSAFCCRLFSPPSAALSSISIRSLTEALPSATASPYEPRVRRAASWISHFHEDFSSGRPSLEKARVIFSSSSSSSSHPSFSLKSENSSLDMPRTWRRQQNPSNKSSSRFCSVYDLLWFLSHPECRVQLCVREAAVFTKHKRCLLLHHLTQQVPHLLHQLQIGIRLDTWEEKNMRSLRGLHFFISHVDSEVTASPRVAAL